MIKTKQNMEMEMEVIKGVQEKINVEELFKEIIMENVPHLVKEIDIKP